MPCYSPLKGYRALRPGPDGKRGIVFNPRHGFVDRPVTIPCGQCSGCRLERSRQWAIRCVHEAQLHENNIFITLTYDNEHLPEDRSVDVRHFQLFMKRLRKLKGEGIRFFHCGEYGDLNHRPHYHALLFNCWFEDRKLWKISNDNPVYTSATLASLWGHGFTSLGDVTFQSAAYVARYVMKKRTGSSSESHYEWVDAATGEVHRRRPEYTTMSRRPGVGSGWLQKYLRDVYPDDFVVIGGRKMRAPKYYDSVLEKDHPQLHKEMKRRRIFNGRKHAANNTRDRLRVREVIQLSKLKQLKRTL